MKTPVRQQTFLALDGPRQPSPLIVLDIGYSERAKSCGLAWTGQQDSVQLRFGEAVEEVARLVAVLGEPVLVLEAPLSTFHNSLGNPAIRGEFETGRGWYWGPGAVALIAARRFLEELDRKLASGRQVLLAEAFLSNKRQRSRHSADASAILDRFWRTKAVVMNEGVEPMLSLIKGIPQVRIFGTSLP